MSEYYFAYGSNMNPERVQERGLVFTRVAKGVLHGFELRFNKADRRHPGEGHANIAQTRSGWVEGVLYELLPGEIFKMDPYERAPWNYGREKVLVSHAFEGHVDDSHQKVDLNKPALAQAHGDSQGALWAWTYFANPAVQREGLTPSSAYLSHLLAGRDWLSQDYFELLQGWQTTDV